MHTIISYKDLPLNERERAALDDVREYLSTRRFLNLVQKFREEKPDLSLGAFEVIISFAGISGYPVNVFYKHIYLK